MHVARQRSAQPSGRRLAGGQRRAAVSGGLARRRPHRARPAAACTSGRRCSASPCCSTCCAGRRAAAPAFALGWCVRLRLLPGRAVLDRDRVLQRCRAFRRCWPLPAVALLCAGMALYPALAAWLAMLHRWRSPTRGGARPGDRLDRHGGAARAAVRRLSLEPDRLCLVGLGCDQPAGRADRDLRPEPAGGRARRLAGGAARARRAGALVAGGRGRRRCSPWSGSAARCGLPAPRSRRCRASGCAWSRATCRSRTNGSRSCATTGSATISASPAVTRRGITPRRSGRNPRAPTRSTRSRRRAALIAQVVPPGGLLLTGGERFDFSQRSAARRGTACSCVDDAGALRGALRQARPGAVRRVPAAARPARPDRARASSTRGSLDFQAGPGRQHDRAAGPAAVQPADLLRGDLSGRGGRARGAPRLAAEHHQRRLVRPQLRAPTSTWRWRACGRSRRGCRWCAAPIPGSRPWSTPGAGCRRASGSARPACSMRRCRSRWPRPLFARARLWPVLLVVLRQPARHGRDREARRDADATG